MLKVRVVVYGFRIAQHARWLRDDRLNGKLWWRHRDHFGGSCLLYGCRLLLLQLHRLLIHRRWWYRLRFK